MPKILFRGKKIDLQQAPKTTYYIQQCHHREYPQVKHFLCHPG